MSTGPKRKKFFRLPIPKRWVEEAVDLEFEHHVLERMDELIEEGYRPEDARAEAERCFGAVRSFRTDCIKIGERRVRTMRIVEGIQSVVQDVRYAVRSALKKPSFALAVILTLSLGIGANGAVFTVMDTALLRPLPYDDPRSLVQVLLHSEESGFSIFGFPTESAFRLRDEIDFLDSIALYGNTSTVRTDTPFPSRVTAYALGSGFLPTMGVQPMLGRGFRPGDHEPGADRVVLLSARAWKEWTGGADDVVGSTIALSEVEFTVVGVLPPEFKLLGDYGNHVFVPLTDTGTALGSPLRELRMFGRNPSGLDVELMGEQGTTILRGLAEEGNAFYGFDALRIDPIWENRANPDLRNALLLMFGGGILLLAVALANGVNLFLIRSAERAGELGVRLSLGGSRKRIGRQILTESLVLAVAGGLLGTAISYYGVEGLMAIAPQFGLSADYHVAFDLRGLLFVFSVTVVLGTALGLIPAFSSLRKVRSAALLQKQTSLAGGRIGGIGRATNVVGQIAIALILLTGAGLLSRSFLKIVGQDIGFDADRIALLNVGLSSERYPTAQDRQLFYDRLEQRVMGLPGVEGVSFSEGMPPDPIVSFGFSWETEESVGDPPPQPMIHPNAVVDPEFFDVLGIEVTEGRTFRADETMDDNTAIIDREFANLLWPGGSALGKRFRAGAEADWITVVGIVEQFKMSGHDVRESSHDLMRPLQGQPAAGYTSLAVRTSGPPSEILPALREAVRALDPLQPVNTLMTGEKALAEGRVSVRFYTLLILFFAIIAVSLAATGVYGVLAYSLSRRRREVGLRIALGAQARQVESMVVMDGIRLAVFGIVLGVGGSLLCSRLLSSLLYDLSPTDMETFCMSTFGMVALVVIASYIPARRATRVDPMEVLSSE